MIGDLDRSLRVTNPETGQVSIFYDIDQEDGARPEAPVAESERHSAETPEDFDTTIDGLSSRVEDDFDTTISDGRDIGPEGGYDFEIDWDEPETSAAVARLSELNGEAQEAVNQWKSEIADIDGDIDVETSSVPDWSTGQPTQTEPTEWPKFENDDVHQTQRKTYIHETNLKRNQAALPAAEASLRAAQEASRSNGSPENQLAEQQAEQNLARINADIQMAESRLAKLRQTNVDPEPATIQSEAAFLAALETPSGEATASEAVTEAQSSASPEEATRDRRIGTWENIMVEDRQDIADRREALIQSMQKFTENPADQQIKRETREVLDRLKYSLDHLSDIKSDLAKWKKEKGEDVSAYEAEEVDAAGDSDLVSQAEALLKAPEKSESTEAAEPSDLSPEPVPDNPEMSVSYAQRSESMQSASSQLLNFAERFGYTNNLMLNHILNPGIIKDCASKLHFVSTKLRERSELAPNDVDRAQQLDNEIAALRASVEGINEELEIAMHQLNDERADLVERNAAQELHQIVSQSREAIK